MTIPGPVREDAAATDFIRDISPRICQAGQHDGRVATRFPPEPNGYLHIGHAKSICLNFGVAREFGGTCNLRFDDTNPTKEDVEYVDSIQDDVRWLGFDWDESRCSSRRTTSSSSTSSREHLIRNGKAYVDSLTADEIRELPRHADRARRATARIATARSKRTSISSRRMRAGEFADGAHVLRAKIDMASPNINMRDPVLYRIRHAHHHRTGDAWCIYPMYDFAHPPRTRIEGITHSLCTLEFENHRPLYDWLIDNLPVPSRAAPDRVRAAESDVHGDEQAQAARARRGEATSPGWDDPRMPTIAGMRRRGYTPEAIRDVLRPHRRRQAREHRRRRRCSSTRSAKI